MPLLLLLIAATFGLIIASLVLFSAPQKNKPKHASRISDTTENNSEISEIKYRKTVGF